MNDHADLSATFTVACQHCGNAMRARPEHIGMAARCPFCENVTTLSLPASDPPQPAPTPPPIPPPKRRRRKRARSEDSQATAADSKQPHARTKLPRGSEDETPTLPSGRRTSVAGSAGLDTTANLPAGSRKKAKRVEVPGYEILGELGRGGMGVVYKARQISLKRKVALKMILAGAHAGGEMLRRFISEAEAVARLQHPNIVQIHEIGHADGLPYFSLEFVAGGSLDDRLAKKPPSFTESAELVRVLAEAIHYAHRQGIVHRDLKPANVLLTKNGTPKITDFGLAKELEGDSHTQDGALLGTPAYMAPEQAAGNIKAIGPATDTYALGAVLYELLTGEVPFVGPNSQAVMAMVQVAEPTPPRQLRADVPHDLETICLKCLEKDPNDRYESAEALADDLLRFIQLEPIQARPIGLAGRTVKWVRRHPQVALLSGLVAAVTFVAFAGISYFSGRAHTATADKVAAEKVAKKERQQNEPLRERVTRAEKEADQSQYPTFLIRAKEAWRADKIAEARQILDQTDPDLRGWEYYYLKNQLHQEGLSFAAHSYEVNGIVYSPDGKLLATCGATEVKVWNAKTGKLVREFKGHKQGDYQKGEHVGVNGVAFSPDSKILLSGGGDRTVRLWDVRTGKQLKKLDHDREVMAVAYSPNGLRFASLRAVRQEDGDAPPMGVRIWDAKTYRRIDPSTNPGLQGGGRQPNRQGFISTEPFPLSFTGNGQFVLAKQVFIDTATGMQVLAYITDPRSNFNSANGQPAELRASIVSPTMPRSSIYQVAAITYTYGSNAYAARLIDAGAPSGGMVQPGSRFGFGGLNRQQAFSNAPRAASIQPNSQKQLLTTTRTLHGLAFNPQGTRLAVAENNVIRLFDIKDNRELQPFKGHTDGIDSITFSPDGKQIAAGAGGKVIVWNTVDSSSSMTVPGSGTDLAITPDSSKLVFAGQELAVFDTSTATDRGALRKDKTDQSWSAVATCPDGIHVAGGKWDGTVTIWNLNRFEKERTLTGLTQPVESIAYSSDSTRLVAVAAQGDVRIAGNQRMQGERAIKVWDVQTGREICSFETGEQVNHPGAQLAFVPDSERFLLFHSSGATVYDSDSGDEVVSLQLKQKETYSITGAAPSPDGLQIVTTGQHGTQMWNAQTGKWQFNFQGPGEQQGQSSSRQAIMDRAVAFSPDGLRVVTAGTDLTVWAADTGQELLRIPGDSPKIATRVAFSLNGRRIAVGGTTKVFDAGADYPVLKTATTKTGKPERTTARPKAAKVSKQNRRYRELAGGQRETSELVFSADDSRLVTVGDDRLAIVWNTNDWSPAARLRNTKDPKSYVYKSLICAAVSHDNRFVAAAVQGARSSTQTGGGRVMLFDAATGAAKFTTPETKSSIGSLQFTPDDRHIVAVDVSLNIYRWLASTGALVPSRQQMPGRGPGAYTAPPLVSPDSKFALGSGQVFGGGIVAIDTAPSNATRTKTVFQYGGRAGLRMRNEPNMTALHALAISGDSRSFAAAGLQFRLKNNGGLAPGFGNAKERVTVWRVGRDWKPINVKIAGELDLSQKTVTALALSPSGKQIAVATWETTEVRIVEVATGKTLATVKHGDGGNVSTLAFSHDGKWLATSGGHGNGANRDPNTRVWDVGDVTGGR